MHLFPSHPTSPVARGHVSAIWDPGYPHQSPQTTIITPKTSPLSLVVSKRVRTSNTLWKLPNAPFLLSTHLTCGKGQCVGHLGPWRSNRSPQTTKFTPIMSPLSLAANQEDKDQLFSLETAKCTISSLTPAHPWQGAMHGPSGTLGGGYMASHYG